MNINALLGSKKLSDFFWKTYREDPQNLETESHRLLHRSGFISQVSSGIFSFLPIGWRSIEKIKHIIREEMNNSGALEINMPVIQSSDLWRNSGRLDTFIPPLARFTDRRENEMIVAPTHEETVTDMVAKNVNSYRDLPFTLYQIQTKYREEPRPRGGLLRVREFEMKDAYSFDKDQKGLDISYKKMVEAYKRIFSRCSTEVVIVDADSGAIGGKESNEFIMLADSGEDLILISENQNYAANVEKAVFKKDVYKKEAEEKIKIIETPNVKTIKQLQELLQVPACKTLKTVVYKFDKKLIGCVIRGDYDINETKLRNYLNATYLEPASEKDITDLDLIPGFISPYEIDSIDFIYDDSVSMGPDNFIIGSNQLDKHYKNFNISRDLDDIKMLDIAEAKEGFFSIDGSVLKAKKGIEVGHVFKLGDSYTKKMGAKFSTNKGSEENILMGCYGIGVGRLLAACIEANRKENSMNLPISIAPFSIYLAPLQMDDKEVMNISEKLFSELSSFGFDVLFDDRDAQPGVKFNDSELLSLPYRIIVSKRNLGSGLLEIFYRDENISNKLSFEETVEYFKKKQFDT
ncbi:MAG: proline--tRNA ligase [Chloroflexi bacterium]|nr:proline--tRNA ligase [Chloroflexota bacterium]|tara:strand:+ start:4403 stop:6130 length:1728 start_codon:yes stop_codon:yes gene_type:complete